MPLPKNGRDNIVRDGEVFYVMGSYCEIHPRKKLYRTESGNQHLYTCKECKNIWYYKNDERISVG